MKQSKSAKIRKMVMQGAPTKDIVKKTGASTQLVYAVRRKMRAKGEVPAPREPGGISEVKPIGMVEMAVYAGDTPAYSATVTDTTPASETKPTFFGRIMKWLKQN